MYWLFDGACKVPKTKGQCEVKNATCVEKSSQRILLRPFLISQALFFHTIKLYNNVIVKKKFLYTCYIVFYVSSYVKFINK